MVPYRQPAATSALRRTGTSLPDYASATSPPTPPPAYESIVSRPTVPPPYQETETQTQSATATAQAPRRGRARLRKRDYLRRSLSEGKKQIRRLGHCVKKAAVYAGLAVLIAVVEITTDPFGFLWGLLKFVAGLVAFVAFVVFLSVAIIATLVTPCMTVQIICDIFNL
ncbi:hypothetical protein BJY01DRAFT_255692 [Aspergillus pseudoustus]|uniref:MARVEL domain-containing protein n=1 Tax=Aspergillus pseudoustus TaxID=1810923 RepID=A0ABR4IL09_9EURO